MREFTITEQVYRMSKLITHNLCDEQTEMYRGMFLMRLLDYAFDETLPLNADWSEIIQFIVDGEVGERTNNAPITHQNADIECENAHKTHIDSNNADANAPFPPSAPSPFSPSSSSPTTPTTPSPISPSSPSTNPEEKTTQKAAHESSLRSEFDLFWQPIQNKKDVQRAFKAWKAMRKRKDTELTPQQLTEIYNQHYAEAREIRFAKRPASWLNAASYLDEPDAPQQDSDIQTALVEPINWHSFAIEQYPQLRDRLETEYKQWDDLPQSIQEAITEDIKQ
jgi:hypothetical protein